MQRSDKILLILCASFVLIIGTLIFILPQKSFSETENRYLSKLEAPTVDSFFNGEYAKSISNFYSDQFPMRSAATSIYAISERAMGKKTVGGVILQDKQLISIPKNKSKKADIPFPSIIVESKYSLLQKNSPELGLYYNTDHHRTTRGAYLIYLSVCKKLNIKPYDESFFKKQTVSKGFYGTDFARSRMPRFMADPDTIELWRYESDKEITLTVHDTQTSSNGFYFPAKLDTSDKYAVFLGGNYAKATISSSPDKPLLLLFKDSYANAVIPFLALHFNIDLIDPRYATASQIKTAYNDTKYDLRLFIGCLESFA